MARTRTLAALTLALALAGCSGSNAHGPIHGDREPQARDRPAWLPEYSSEQKALLAPTTTPASTPSHHVYPDPARFSYAPNRPVSDPRSSFKFTQLIARVLDESPRLYVFGEAPAQLSNVVAQYGPPPSDEASGWQVTKRDANGFGTLVEAAVAPDAKAAHDKGRAALAKGDAAAATAELRKAVELSPAVPELWIALGDALAPSSPAEAQGAYQKALEIDPTFASAHRALAAVRWNGADRAGAQRELAIALAHNPRSPSARALAADMGFTIDDRGSLLALFLEVDSLGAIRVAGRGTSSLQMYGACRAVMRYEPGVRSAILSEPVETPYHLSVTEEVICLETAIGAYLFEMADAEQENKAFTPDPLLEALVRLAQDQGLTGFVMFEILGRYRPERARTAPEDVIQGTVAYIETHVLGSAPALPPGHVTASLR